MVTGSFAWYPMPYDTGNFIFATTIAQTHEFDNGRISVELHNKFQQNGIPLSNNAKITWLRKERRWLLIDGDNRYLLKKGQKDFRVVKLPHRNGNRIFPHTKPTIAGYESMQDLQKAICGDKLIVPCHCVELGARFHFTVDFWNLSDDELKHLIWSLQLNEGLGHKIGKGKSLGFGSCKITISPQQSWEYDWSERYRSNDSQHLGRRPIAADFLAYTRNQRNEAQMYRLLSLSQSNNVETSAGTGENQAQSVAPETEVAAKKTMEVAAKKPSVRGEPFALDKLESELAKKLQSYEKQLDTACHVLYKVTSIAGNATKGMAVFRIEGEWRQEADWDWKPKGGATGIKEGTWFLGNLDACDFKIPTWKKINQKAQPI
jgi:hypothetical protein